MILLLDNYDSFTYNLCDYLQQTGTQVLVKKNDEVSIEDIRRLSPAAIVLSPGPGRPEDAGVTLTVIRTFAGEIPLFGVCLGHQAIAAAFGASIVPAEQPVHGKTALIQHDNQTLFHGLPNPLRVARYHSLMVDVASLPDCLLVSASTEDGVVMALRHTHLPIEAVQFHPEAIQTECGKQLVRRFVEHYVNR